MVPANSGRGLGHLILASPQRHRRLNLFTDGGFQSGLQMSFEGMAYVYKLMSQIQQVSYPATSYSLSDVVPIGIHGALLKSPGVLCSPGRSE
jgi:hypothetical protein